VLEGIGDGNEGKCPEIGVVACYHLKVRKVIVKVQQSGPVDGTEVEQVFLRGLEEVKQLRDRTYWLLHLRLNFYYA
jgi:hypothetical protein